METIGDQVDDEYDDYDQTEDVVLPEGIVVWKLKRALMDGDPIRAGKALRLLPQIRGDIKNVLADMLEGSPNLEELFQWHLKFVPRRKGRSRTSAWQGREFEEKAWEAVHKYYLPKIKNKKAAFAKAAKDLKWSEGQVKKYYYLRNKRNLGLAPLPEEALAAISKL